jgi:endonuclease/exonuclease/phosphatase (EEP) superfamily protein YafD
MLTRKHFLIFLSITIFLIIGVFVGREMRTMKNYIQLDGPRFVGQAAAQQLDYDGTLRVVTWNIRFAEAVETAVAELKTIPTLQNADILLLQEMDEQGVALMAQALNANYVYYPASVHSYHNRNFGNAILTKWPIIEDEKLLLPHENPSNEQRRNAVRAVVDINGKEVLVYSIHTETYWLSQGKRNGQGNAIVEDILSTPSFDFVIVGGDFNTVTENDIKELDSLFGLAELERVSKGAGASVNVLGVDIEADHIFARGFTPIDNGNYSETVASDHFPIWADLFVEKK